MAFTLFIVFLILKLTKVIDWSWVWVTSPLWISFAFTIVIYIFALLCGGMIAIMDCITYC